MLRDPGLQILQPVQLGYCHAAIFGFPLVQGGVRYTVFPAELQDLCPASLLLQNPDDLFLSERCLPHSSASSLF